MNNYTETETAKFKAERRERTKKFKTALSGRGKRIEINYPANLPAYKRGFTPAGSAMLHFDALNRMSIRPDRLGTKSINRKPSFGSKRIFQIITGSKTMVIPAKYNVYGELVRRALEWIKKTFKVIHHDRPLRNQPSLF